MKSPPPPGHPLLQRWWTDSSADPDRPTVANPDVRRLAERISPGDDLIDLGGTMSLNARLPGAGLVLRVHRPFVSRQRIACEQVVRQSLAGMGPRTATPIPFRGKTILRCGPRLAELEAYVPHAKPPPTVEHFRWLFHELGRLHRHLRAIDIPITVPAAATYAPPGSLARWLTVTVSTLSVTDEGRTHAKRLRHLVNGVRQTWVPARYLPVQIIHGDFRLGNIVRDLSGDTVFLDFGFTAVRPRIHDLGYSLAFMVLALGPEHVEPAFIEELVAGYGESARKPLTSTEIAALSASAASTMLHAAAHDGYTGDPLALLDQRRQFLDVAEWFLANTGMFTCR